MTRSLKSLYLSIQSDESTVVETKKQSKWWSVSEVSVHDVTQLEIKTVHAIPEGIPLGADISYVQDMYFFLPKSLGLHTESYSKELFYRSLANYIRVKTPRVLGDDELHQCRIDKVLPRLSAAAQEGVLPADVILAVNEIRLFAAFVNDQFKVLSHSEVCQTSWDDLSEFVELVYAFRGVMDKLLPITQGKPDWDQLTEALRYIDEYLSNRIEEVIVDFAVPNHSVAATLMRTEFNRRREMGYLQVLIEDNGPTEERARELYVFRMGRLKKYISEILYLEVKRAKHDQLFTNIAAAIGAACAAFIHALADPNAQTSMSGHFFANLRGSLPMMIGAVAAIYVFKDRVKEILRLSLLYWFKPMLPDYSFKINGRQGQEIGHCKEDVRFVNTAKIPVDILFARRDNSEIILPSDSFEDVIHYNRSLTMHRKELEALFKNTNSLKDIIRYDFNPFLTKLSNPRHKDLFIKSDGSMVEVDLPKVYHVNIVIKHRSYTKGTGDLSTYYTRARIILDKNGIKRVEPVPVNEEKIMQELGAATQVA